MAFRSLPGHVMGWELMVVVFLAMEFSLLFSHGLVEGERDYALSREEELELDIQLKVLNKPAIKSIESDGDIFDCVDINKQPAFDHPLLKNHKIQMMPGSYPKGLINEAPPTVAYSQIKLSKECPSGTVPIRRTLKEELIRENFNPIYNEKYSPNISTLASTSKVVRHMAVHHANFDFYGLRAYLNVYGLPEVSLEQFSSVGICLGNGFPRPKEQVNIVQAGWMANGYNSEGCYNLMCPGFVQISKTIPLGIAIQPLSSYGGKQYVLILQIYKDPNTTNWWLLLGDSSIPVGYWPNDLFTYLADYASEIYLGGLVGYGGDALGPAMGNRHIPDEGPGKPCYISHIQLVDKENHLKDLQYWYSDRIMDKSECYKVSEIWDTSKFYFGGPAGCK